MRVEAAAFEDSRAIAEVHVASWQAAYTGIVSASYLASISVEQREASWKKRLLEGLPQILVAREGSSLVGFVAFDACRDAQAPSSYGEIWALYVLPVALVSRSRKNPLADRARVATGARLHHRHALGARAQ